MAKDPVAQYLQRYAEPCDYIPEALLRTKHQYNHVLIIPAYHEAPDFLEHVLSRLHLDNRLLVIAVINAPDYDFPTREQIQAREETQLLLNELSRRNLQQWRHQSSYLSLHSFSANPLIDLLLMDYCSLNHRLPRQEGVGRARKIAADFACRLIHAQVVTSRWIFNTDADVHLPANFFNVPADCASSALLYPFQHQVTDPSLELATALYECKLHYYVAGLVYAGSPYAYQSIGSCFSIDYRHYCLVRGFPRRNGAEDFYLLNKLNKTASFTQLQEPVIEIKARRSTRVPFGTGPALAEISTQPDALRKWTFYNPEVFELLRSWLALWPRIWLTKRQADFREADLSDLVVNQGYTEQFARILNQLNAAPAINRLLKNSPSETVFLTHMHTWFDAFRTLKFIHTARDLYLPSLPFAQSVASASHIRGAAGGFSSLALGRLIAKLRLADPLQRESAIEG